jgi:type II secretory pathway component PulF
MKLTAQIQILPRVTFQEKLLFTKHLDTMIKAGIPIVEALGTLVDQARSPKFRKIIDSVLADVKNGQSLASSFKKFPKVFNQFYVSLIEVGEESGTLEENLTFLSKQMAKDFRLRKKIVGTMIYPAIVVFAMTIMGGFISFFVLPKLVDFFASFEVELPFSTKVLLIIANAMKDYGHLIFAGIVLVLILFRTMTRLSFIKPKWHALVLHLPGLGKVIMYGQLSRFSRNLGTLIKSGVPITKGLAITADTLSNLKFKNDLLAVSKALVKGKNVGETLKKNDYFEYPPLVSKMISIGEKTGKLDETLLYLGDYYDDEVDDLSKNLSTVIEPILLLAIGLGVGFIAVAIISPIYELTGSIRK